MSAFPASALSWLESGFVWRCAASASNPALTSPSEFETTCHKIRCSAGRREKSVSGVVWMRGLYPPWRKQEKERDREKWRGVVFSGVLLHSHQLRDGKPEAIVSNLTNKRASQTEGIIDEPRAFKTISFLRWFPDNEMLYIVCTFRLFVSWSRDCLGNQIWQLPRPF